MKKIKQISLSLFIIGISAGYVVLQPQKTNALLVQTATVDTQKKQTATQNGTTTESTSGDDKPLVLSVPKKETPPPTQTQNTFSYKKDTQPPVPKKTKTQTKTNSYTAPQPQPQSPTVPPPKKATPPAIVSKGRYVDGVYTSSPVNAYYGIVQIKTTVKQGKIVAVDFLQHPDNRSTSQMINGQAMPLLQREAIQAQSANVSGVSGATYTSRAFRKALKDVVLQATG